MKGQSLLIIALAAIAAVAALWWIGSDRGSPAEQTLSGPLFEGLAASVNEVEQIKLSNAAGDTATVIKDDAHWRVVEVHNYPADTGKLRQFLVALGNARIVETKTSNPEYYSRLGVQDLDQEDSAAVRVEVTQGEQTYDLLVGSDAPRAGGAVYVRKTGESSSLLVDAALDASAVAAEWVNTSILDVAAASVQSVQILEDGGRSEIAKSDRTQTEFELSPVQEAPLDTAEANVLSRSLAGLTLQQLVPSSGFDASAFMARDFTFVLFDGVIIDVKVFAADATDEANATHWFNASARFDAELAQKLMPQPSVAEDLAEDAETDATEFKLTETDLLVRQQQADTINERLRGWVYAISKQRYDRFKSSDELKP